MKLYVTKDNVNHRGITVNKGDVIEEDDRNHIGSLQSVGCQIYDEERHGAPKAEAPKPAPVEKPEPEPAKKTAPKKKGAKPRKK